MFYTYLHKRNDTDKVFYVGKGKDKRAWITRRSKWWHSIVSKYGYSIEICAHWPTEAEAFEHERFLIACFKDLNHPLINQTAGGEGTAGLEPWNKGLIGAPNAGGVRKGQKRPGIGGVKLGNVPWNKGLTGIPGGKKGKKYPNSHSEEVRLKKKGRKRSPLSVYKGLVNRYGQSVADNWLTKSGIQLPDLFG